MALIIPSVAHADLRSEVVDTANRIINRTIIPDFEPLVQASHPGFFREYRIVPDPQGMAPFVDTQNKRISIPADLLIYMLFSTTGTAITQVAPEYSEAIHRYLEYMVQVSQDKSKDPLSTVMPFWQFAKITHDTAVSIEQSPLYVRTFEHYYSHALAFIIAHEICHIVKGHKTSGISNIESQNQEFEADAYAMDMMHKLGTYLFHGIYALYPYMSTEPQITPTALRSHPDIWCRLYKIFEAELPLLESNPGYTDAITQHSIDTTRLRRDMESIKESCLKQQ